MRLPCIAWPRPNFSLVNSMRDPVPAAAIRARNLTKLVQSGDAQTGYVANEDLTPAPPLSHGPDVSPSSESPDRNAPLPRPDLEALPADAPEG